MYGWVDDTRDWRGSHPYNFGAARRRFDDAARRAGATGPRAYQGRTVPNISLVNPRGKIISSASRNPVIIGVDITASMIDWPGEIFDRLPLLYKTLAKHRDDLEIAFGAIGDANTNTYPLQVTEFSRAINDLETNLNALGCEGKGGSGINESYELFGYFLLHHCQTPNVRPILLVYGDEKGYGVVDPHQAQHFMGDVVQERITAAETWQAISRRFDVYFLQKPYGDGDRHQITNEIQEYWENHLGMERVIRIPHKERAVDVGLGLIAKKWGQYDDFTRSLDARHDNQKIKDEVHHVLQHIAIEQEAGAV